MTDTIWPPSLWVQAPGLVDLSSRSLMTPLDNFGKELTISASNSPPAVPVLRKGASIREVSSGFMQRICYSINQRLFRGSINQARMILQDPAGDLVIIARRWLCHYPRPLYRHYRTTLG